MMLLKRLRKVLEDNMAKNARRKGKSARNGNAPSPYTKYQKKPHVYSQKYREWRADRLAGRVKPEKANWKAEDRQEIREYKVAAE